MTNATAKLRQVDQNGVKTGMATTIILLIIAFIIDSWVLVAVVTTAQLLGAVGAPFAPYKLFYRVVVKPSGLVEPDIIPDNPEPHRFAMLFGGLFDAAAVLALIGGLPVLAWGLVGIVVALANLNFWVGFCMGCWVYYRLERLGVPGFVHSPVSK